MPFIVIPTRPPKSEVLNPDNGENTSCMVFLTNITEIQDDIRWKDSFRSDSGDNPSQYICSFMINKIGGARVTNSNCCLFFFFFLFFTRE